MEILSHLPIESPLPFIRQDKTENSPATAAEPLDGFVAQENTAEQASVSTHLKPSFSSTVTHEQPKIIISGEHPGSPPDAGTTGRSETDESQKASGTPGTITLLDTPALSKGPSAFTPEALEQFYLVQGSDGTQSLSEEGMQLFAAVKAEFLDPIPKCPFGSSTLYMTAGLPGSGKGYVLKKLLGDNPQFVLVDPDEVKKEVIRDTAERSPHLQSSIAGEKTWGSITHKVSSVIANKLLGEALQSGKDVLYDSTMTAPAIDRYWKFAGIARSNGYKINGIVVKVTPPTAEKRAIERAKKPTKIPLGDGTTLQIPGRWAPMKFFECEKNLNRNLDEAFKGGLFDRCSVFDNETEGCPAKHLLDYERKEATGGGYRCVRTA